MVKLENVYKTYGGAKKPAVNGVNLEIKQGELFCILGPSGCGKTTILRMIAGLENPTDGVIKIRGEVVDDVRGAKFVPSKDRDVGVVFQNYALWPHMKVKDNVKFGPKIKKFSKEESDKAVNFALEKLSILNYANRFPSELSGGQQQRVAIARTLAAKNEIMLLDEPLSNLDARLRLEMRAEFDRIHRELGVTMIFVTHDQWEAMTLATRIVVMSEGEIQQVGTPMEIYNTPANRFVAEFMGSPPLNIIEVGIKDGLGLRLEEWLKKNDIVGSSAGIRPENLRFSKRGENPEGSLGIDLTVSGILPTGGLWIVEVSDGENERFGTTTLTPEVSISDDVVAWAEPKDVLVFNENGKRVETKFN